MFEAREQMMMQINEARFKNHNENDNVDKRGRERS